MPVAPNDVLIAAIGSIVRANLLLSLVVCLCYVQFTIALRENRPCFLEAPQWQAVIMSKPADSILESEWVDSWQT